MKKIFMAACVMAMVASCTTIRKTATTMEVDSSLKSYTEADLVVSSEKITYSYKPESAVKRGGRTNIQNVAIREALKANKADVLVAPQFEIRTWSGLIRKKVVKEVIVSGYPATYQNFRVK